MKIFSPILKGTTTVVQGTTNLSGSFTGSLFGTAATASYADNFTVGGTLTAQTINVQTITSSIEFNTGSTRNGALSTNTHQFTGSVLMSGSLNVGSSVTATTPSNLFKEGFTIQATTTSGPGSQPAYTYYTAAGSKRYSHFLDVGSDKFNIANASNSEVFTINQSGSVGIGTTSPTFKLEVTSSGDGISVTTSNSSQALRISSATNHNTLFRINNFNGNFYDIQNQPSDNSLVIDYNDNERMRITSVGNVGVGTGAPLYKIHIVNGGGNAFLGISNQGVSNGDRQLRLGFGGNGSNTFAEIQGTRANIADDVNIVMQAGGGNVLIGTSTDKARLTVEAGGASTSRPTLSLRQGDSGFDYTNISGAGDQYHGLILRGFPAAAGDYSVTPGDYMSFYEYGADFRFYKKQPGILTNQVRFLEGTIYASNTSVQSISDIRTKENITNSEQGLDVITALRPVRFDFKDEFNQGKKNQLGFIAQEMEEIFPDAVGEWEDDNDGITYKTVGPGALIPVLVKAIQELKSENDTLKEILQRNNIQ
jgi:hypothetical protein